MNIKDWGGKMRENLGDRDVRLGTIPKRFVEILELLNYKKALAYLNDSFEVFNCAGTMKKNKNVFLCLLFFFNQFLPKHKS